MKEYVVITGANSGIGQALTINFANMGYHVLAIGRNQLSLQHTKILSKKDMVTPIIVDLNQSDALDIILRNFNSEATVKYLVHCAAMLDPISPLCKVNEFQWQQNMNINSKIPIFLTQKLTSYLNNKSRVLFIGSDYAGLNKIRKNFSAYAISKSALRAAVEYFRHEYQDLALIGYLNPGPTNTALYRKFWDALQKNDTLVQATVQPSKPSDVADFIKAVLENSSPKDFSGTDWDYRSSTQHESLKKDKILLQNPLLRAKL